MINIKNLTVAYDDEIILDNLSLDINLGEMIAIIGPNGAGKSTFIKSVLNFVKPLYGEISFFNEKYEKIKKRIAYVPQKESVDWDFPTTVIDVVKMGSYGEIGLFKRVGKIYTDKAINMLEKVEMTKFLDRQINELSGGQKQRVFIARSLMQNADIYFLDEPFQGIDKATEKIIINLLKKLKEEGKTIIIVHHDLNTVVEYFDKVIMINKELIAYGNVKEVFTKENIEKTYNKDMGWSY